MENTKSIKINGIDCQIDMIDQSTTQGSMGWNEAQTEQIQHPQHSTIKFRVTCRNRQLAEDANAELVRKAYAVAREYGCKMQHSGGMTSTWNAVKFGVTFHGDNSDICANEMI